MEGVDADVEGRGTGGDGVLDAGAVGELLLDVGVVEKEVDGALVAGELSEGLVEDCLGLKEPDEVDVDEEDGVESRAEQGEDAGGSPEGREARLDARMGTDDEEEREEVDGHHQRGGVAVGEVLAEAFDTDGQSDDGGGDVGEDRGARGSGPVAGEVPGDGEAEDKEGEVGSGQQCKLLPGAGLVLCPDEVIGADVGAEAEDGVEVGADIGFGGDGPGNEDGQSDEQRVEERAQRQLPDVEEEVEQDDAEEHREYEDDVGGLGGEVGAEDESEGEDAAGGEGFVLRGVGEEQEQSEEAGG